MRESKIENYLVSQVKKLGGKSIKMLPTFEAGIPDRLVLYKGKAYFVELKAPGEEPRPLQVNFMRELAAVGHFTCVIDSIDKVNSFIVDITLGYYDETCESCKGSGLSSTGIFGCGRCQARGYIRHSL